MPCSWKVATELEAYIAKGAAVSAPTAAPCPSVSQSVCVLRAWVGCEPIPGVDILKPAQVGIVTSYEFHS